MCLPATGLPWRGELEEIIVINKIWEIPNICYMSVIEAGVGLNAEDGLQTLKLTGRWRLRRMGQLSSGASRPRVLAQSSSDSGATQLK